MPLIVLWSPSQSTLLQLLAIAVPLAFGERNVLTVYHDFQTSGRGKLRHSLCSVLCEAIKARFGLTDAQLQNELDSFSGVPVSRALWACHALGRREKPSCTVTVVFIADELQHLFDNDRPSQSLLTEIAILVRAPGVASFFSGSAYHLVDGLEEAGMKMQEKQPIVRLLPITTRKELGLTMAFWHDSWRDPAEFAANNLSAPALQAALETRVFLATGGVLRLMIDLNRAEQPDVPEPTGSALAVLALLYSANRSRLESRAVAALAPGASAAAKVAARSGPLPFDPFDQEPVPVREVCTACAEDDPMTVSEVHELADAGWLLLFMSNAVECASFLRPKHYALMESTQHGLSLLERAAIRFPEGRTLGEQWEAFYAEHLQERLGLQWAPASAAAHFGVFHHQVPQTEAFFISHANTLFKPKPDSIGMGTVDYTRGGMAQER